VAECTSDNGVTLLIRDERQPDTRCTRRPRRLWAAAGERER
jgi:hypothetical protein